ncbi:MAG: leucine-rich repeat protein [Paludibacteraceae bacterium]|nr:leucine-rich repeat protein [Paludibacteraceae bacterium]
MSDIFNPPNSIWPNGMQVDSDGYAAFYPLGTNKVNVPTSCTQWPKGNKLVSPFVYQDDKLVGFADTKALTTDSQTTIYLPYEHIEAEFSAIEKGQLQIHAPNATTKKASWKDSGVEDIPEAQFKYKGCKTVNDVKAVDANYQTNDIVNGVWSEPLWDFENADDMFYRFGKLTSFTSDLPSLTRGDNMFEFCYNLTTFTSNLSNLTNGEEMFYNCNNLATFTSDLPSLTDGYMMFHSCSELTSFTSNLSNLTNGHYMFTNCPKLASFTSDLPSLTDGRWMFNGSGFESFSSDLSNLLDGNWMFWDCVNLTSFSSDLSRLTNGNTMFYGCSNLTTFTSNLPSLTNGDYMFYECKLNTASVQNIADTINDVNSLENEHECGGVWKYIHIGIGNSEPNEQEEIAFNTIASKGWTVYVNGSQYTPTSPAAITTLDENCEETVTPIPFWAKPVQTDEEHAKYIDSEGNFFNILGAQFIYGDDISTYGMFTCEEDAVANMRLTPYTKPQTETINNN